MKQGLPKIGLFILSALIVLCLAELLFRFFADSGSELSAEKIWETQRANLRKAYKNVRTEIGGITFREEKTGEEIFDEPYIRILFLGDSFTIGAGIRDHQDRFSEIAEARLNQELAGAESPRRVHIFNAGKAGSNPRLWDTYFKVVEPVYKPHFVYAIFFLRNGTRLGTSLAHQKEIIDPIREKYWNMPLYNLSAMVRFFYNRLAWREYTMQFKEILTSSYLGSPDERAVWREQQQALLGISRACQEKNISFHLVIFPILFNLKDYEFHEVEKEIQAFAENHDIPVFPLTPGFLGENDRTLWVASNDQHPNEKGHRIAAETLLPYLRTMLPQLK